MTASNIAERLKMTRQPVAVIRSDTCPEGAIQFPEGKWGCIIALLNQASKGHTAALSDKTTVCQGGRAGTGFQPFELGKIEYFLSTGGRDPRPPEYYKETPELARDYIQSMPRITPKAYLLFKPLSEVTEGDQIGSVVFLVNADQLSGLITLANYDRPPEGEVEIRFGSGCAQSILFTLADAEQGKSTCRIGLTDPSARKCIEKDILSFSIPYARYLELEEKAAGSFLSTETWETIRRRI